MLSVDNSDLVLRPGMTATAQITVQEISMPCWFPTRRCAIRRRFRHRQESFSLSRLFMPRMPRGGGRPAQNEPATGERTVWALKNNEPVSLGIKTGASDGKLTEVTEGELDTDTALITASKKGRD